MKERQQNTREDGTIRVTVDLFLGPTCSQSPSTFSCESPQSSASNSCWSAMCAPPCEQCTAMWQWKPWQQIVWIEHNHDHQQEQLQLAALASHGANWGHQWKTLFLLHPKEVNPQPSGLVLQCRCRLATNHNSSATALLRCQVSYSPLYTELKSTIKAFA